MKDNRAKYPQLRFKGCTDPWEQCKLGEVATFINGRAYKQNELLDSGKYKVLRVGNFYTNDSWYYSNMELGDKYYIDKGDLVYTWSATFGPHIWNGEKVIYHYHIWKVELSKLLDRDFTLQLLEADKARLLSNTNGSTMIHVTKGDMESKSVTIPNIDEQNQIGTFFQHLDHLITLHQRKLVKLKKLKQGYLQKMFPKNGSKFPQLRFAGFADAWEQRKLGEITISFDSQRVPLESSTRQSGSYPYYGATGVIDSVNDYIFDGEYVLLAEDGANIVTRTSPIAYLTHGKFWLNNHAHIMKVREGSDYFLLSLLEKIDYSKFNSGTAQPKLNSKTVSGLNVMIPTAQEQMHIAALLRSLDKAIALHQRKLEKLQELKKGYLQKMFC
jgi:type I restriction enzyme S subunit